MVLSRGYHLRWEVRDNIVGIEEITSAVQNVGAIPPHETNFKHLWSVLIGLDVMLERARGHALSERQSGAPSWPAAEPPGSAASRRASRAWAASGSSTGWLRRCRERSGVRRCSSPTRRMRRPGGPTSGSCPTCARVSARWAGSTPRWWRRPRRWSASPGTCRSSPAPLIRRLAEGLRDHDAVLPGARARAASSRSAPRMGRPAGTRSPPAWTRAIFAPSASMRASVSVSSLSPRWRWRATRALLFFNVNTADDLAQADELWRRHGSSPIIGRKNAGKTTLTVALASELVRRGHRVMTIKHGHHSGRGGPPGHRQLAPLPRGQGRAGAARDARSCGCSSSGRDDEYDPIALARRYLSGAEIVLAEGFKQSAAPQDRGLSARGLPDPPLYDPDAAQRATSGSPSSPTTPTSTPSCPVLRFQDTMWLQLLASLAWDQARIIPDVTGPLAARRGGARGSSPTSAASLPSGFRWTTRSTRCSPRTS